MSPLDEAHLLTAILAGIVALLGAVTLLPIGPALYRALPRANKTGAVLATLCWAWVAAELTLHPIDFLAFLKPSYIIALCVICVPLSWVLLRNLLCPRAIGGLLMLWPMPVILAVRDFETAWRLVPITLGYISLTAGMFAVFYPWMVRVFCEKLSVSIHAQRNRALFGILLLLAAALLLIALISYGKVIGE